MFNEPDNSQRPTNPLFLLKKSMSSSSPRSIASLIGNEPDSLLERLVAQQSNHDTLIHYLKTNLSHKEAEHLVAVSCRGDNLLLVADSPAWANLIRYKSAKLLKLLHETEQSFGNLDLKAITKVVVRTTASEMK